MRSFLTQTYLLLASSTGCAFFGPPHNHRHARARQVTFHFQKNYLAAFADPSESPTTLFSSTSSAGPPFRLKHIDHVVIRCQNFPLMFDFYHRILGCTIDEPRDDHLNRFGGALTHLRAGSCYIDLLAYDTNHLTEEGQEAAARMHAGGAGLGSKSLADVTFSSESSTLDHLCIRIDPFDQQRVLEYLKEENVDIVVAGDRRLGADGVGPSVYVRDPEGNVIELKGSPYQDNAQNDIDYNSKINQVDKSSYVPNDAIQQPGEKDAENNELPSNDTQKLAVKNSSPSDNIPMTPCNRICRYNSSFYDGQVCIGCFREAYEISIWQSMTPMQKSMTLMDAIDRCAGGENFDGTITMEESLTRQYLYWSDLAKKTS